MGNRLTAFDGMRSFIIGLVVGIALAFLLNSVWMRSLRKEDEDDFGLAQQSHRKLQDIKFEYKPNDIGHAYPRILCWVPSKMSYGPTIEVVTDTWGNTCDLLIFTSTSSNVTYNVVKLDLSTKDNLWNIVHPAWNYIEENFADLFDWFVKLDDDSNFSGHNFKHLVKKWNPDDYFYLGHTTFHSGFVPFNLGLGHAISRGTLKRIGPFLPDSKKPLPAGARSKCSRAKVWSEDLELRNCLHLTGIGEPNNTRDLWGRENFNGFLPQDNLRGVRRQDSVSWYWKGKPKTVGSGIKCCSSRPISWHGLKRNEIYFNYALQYLLYDVKVDPIRKSSYESVTSLV